MAVSSFFGGGVSQPPVQRTTPSVLNPLGVVGPVNLAIMNDVRNGSPIAREANQPGTRLFSESDLKTINSFLMNIQPALLNPSQYIFNPGSGAGVVIGEGGLPTGTTGLTPQQEQIFQQYQQKQREFEEAKKKSTLEQFGRFVGDIGPILMAPLAVTGLQNLAAGAAAGAGETAAGAGEWAIGSGEALGGGLGSGMGLGGAEFATGGLGGLADVVGSDWAAGLPGTANPGLLSGATGYAGAAGGLTDALTNVPTSPLTGGGGTGGVDVNSLLNPGAYQDQLASNLLNNPTQDLATSLFGNPGSGGIYDFISGTVGGLAPELGGAGALLGGGNNVANASILRRIGEAIGLPPELMDAIGQGSDLVTGLLGSPLGQFIGGVVGNNSARSAVSEAGNLQALAGLLSTQAQMDMFNRMLAAQQEQAASTRQRVDSIFNIPGLNLDDLSKDVFSKMEALAAPDETMALNRFIDSLVTKGTFGLGLESEGGRNPNVRPYGDLLSRDRIQRELAALGFAQNQLQQERGSRIQAEGVAAGVPVTINQMSPSAFTGLLGGTTSAAQGNLSSSVMNQNFFRNLLDSIMTGTGGRGAINTGLF